jgi:hypothetical protein
MIRFDRFQPEGHSIAEVDDEDLTAAAFAVLAAIVEINETGRLVAGMIGSFSVGGGVSRRHRRSPAMATKPAGRNPTKAKGLQGCRKH